LKDFLEPAPTGLIYLISKMYAHYIQFVGWAMPIIFN